MSIDMLNHSVNSDNNSKKFVLEERYVAALAYLLFVIPLILEPKTKFTIYHANQSLWLAILSLVIYNVIVVLFNFLAFCVVPLLTLFTIIFAIIGAVNALNNEMKPLPGFDKLPTILKE